VPGTAAGATIAPAEEEEEVKEDEEAANDATGTLSDVFVAATVPGVAIIDDDAIMAIAGVHCCCCER
jgi:hypothetical protein